jgi:hypothetical protein
VHDHKSPKTRERNFEGLLRNRSFKIPPSPSQAPFNYSNTSDEFFCEPRLKPSNKNVQKSHYPSTDKLRLTKHISSPLEFNHERRNYGDSKENMGPRCMPSRRTELGRRRANGRRLDFIGGMVSFKVFYAFSRMK